MLTNGVALHHDSACTYMAALTIEIIWKLNFEFLTHPAYSPDLAPFDYHIFGVLVDALHEHQFANEEVKDMVHTWLCIQLKTFFTYAIQKLVDWSTGLHWKMTVYLFLWVFCTLKKIINCPYFLNYTFTIWIGRVKVKLSLCFNRASHHEGVLGSGGIAPHILWPWH
jgi:hypothetical protein